MIIGIAGKAGHGKDTVANFIVEMVPDAKRRAFADPLKKMALAIDPLIEGNKRLSDFVANPDGWQSAKKHPEVRRFLQRLGTEGVRGTLGEETWVNHLLDEYYADWDLSGEPVYVIPDVRFPNELSVCDEVITVIRPDAADLGENSGHASEQLIDGNYKILNDSDLEHLWTRVHELMDELELL
jgi:hypothetical protein